MKKFKKEHIVAYLRALMLTIILPVFLLGNVNAQQLSVAEKSVSSLGAENAGLKLLQGNFDVKETIWSSPTSKPVYKLALRYQYTKAMAAVSKITGACLN